MKKCEDENNLSALLNEEGKIIVYTLQAKTHGLTLLRN